MGSPEASRAPAPLMARIKPQVGPVKIFQELGDEIEQSNVVRPYPAMAEVMAAATSSNFLKRPEA